MPTQVIQSDDLKVSALKKGLTGGRSNDFIRSNGQDSTGLDSPMNSPGSPGFEICQDNSGAGSDQILEVAGMLRPFESTDKSGAGSAFPNQSGRNPSQVPSNPSECYDPSNGKYRDTGSAPGAESVSHGPGSHMSLPEDRLTSKNSRN